MIWSARRADLAWYMPDAPFWYALQVPFVFAGLLVITASRRKPRSAARLQTLVRSISVCGCFGLTLPMD